MEQDRSAIATVLQRLRDHIADAFTLTEGRSPGELVADHLARLALERCIAFIAEASKCIPAEWKSELPNIRWDVLAGLAARLHDPGQEVDVDQLWQVVETDLPRLEGALDGLLGRANAA
ncbi:MAG TPA: HepT-like ribonuclease domain-containing protein [Hyphomicrobiales bacterium]|nr:HepT-like ribonuclease domain-containing protein [Hyphomicrobiales bacterium]